ncbi:alpha-amylase domain-containing protein [Hymenobacter properus]
MDGSPMLYFEDVFNVGNTSKRYIHSPKSTTDLPTRDDLVNLVWCHQNLHFKDGAYKVRWQAADHLVIERSTKAIIGINDSYANWQNNTVSCDFAPGTVLKDYSGANGTATVTVSSSQTVAINTPPCNGTAAGGRRGYSVWAPVNATTGYTRPALATTQEWELADDLGDADSRSLMQGGALPGGSTAYRTAGRIYVAANKTVTYNLYPTDATRSLTVAVLNSAGTVVSSQTGTGTLTGTYTVPSEGWYTLKAKNASTANPTQGAFVKVTYTAPTVVTGAMTGRRDANVLATAQEAPAAEVSVYPNPTAADRIDVVITANREQAATVQLHDLMGRLVHQETVRLYNGSNELRLGVKTALAAGIYQLSVPEFHVSQKVAVR